jgi:hypothetical protein
MEAKLKAILNVRFLDHVKATNKFPGDADDKWFGAIGRFIFEFSRLEYTLRQYVAREIGLHDQHFVAIASQFNFAGLCAAAYVGLHYIGPSIQDDLGEPPAHVLKRKWKRQRKIWEDLVDEHERMLKKLVNECKSLNEDRVRIVHGLWNIAGETRDLNYVSRYNFTHKTYFQDANELAEKAEKAARLRSEFEEVVGMAWR